MYIDTAIMTHTRLTTITCMRTFCSILPVGSRSLLRSYIACDTNNDFVSLGKPYWVQAGVADKIDLRLKPATETMQELIDAGESKTFDVIFIDADKPNYINYYEFGMQLLRKGGMVMVDNALWSGQVVDPGKYNDLKTTTIRRLNDLMLNDSRIEYLLLQVSDGIGIGLKL